LVMGEAVLRDRVIPLQRREIKERYKKKEVKKDELLGINFKVMKKRIV